MNGYNVLSQQAIEHRNYWVGEIAKISGNFGQDSTRVSEELRTEVKNKGCEILNNHLRLCGVIPEAYHHDSSEEKLYSKYTDILLDLCFKHIGLTSLVLTERADAADVEVVCDSYSFVADAKSFRLSRTAKNQKDFKIQAMDIWKRGKRYAIVVCPLYQLPSTNSQIYQQAAARNVCILSYSHLSVLLNVREQIGTQSSINLLGKVLQQVEGLAPSKSAVSYWTAVNQSVLQHASCIPDIWKQEKLATLDAIAIAKDEALAALAQERETIMKMSRDEAIQSLITGRKLSTREKVIRAVVDNQLLDLA